MDDSQNTANNAFESFLAQDYKACNEALNKLKTGNIQNEKEIAHIKQNIFTSEFVGGKITNVNTLLNKLDELYNEVKTQASASGKTEATKASGELEEDLGGAISHNIDDGGVLRYNYAMALQLSGKKFQSAQLLDEIVQDNSNKDIYTTLKAALSYLELAIIQKDYKLIKRILEYVQKLKSYLLTMRTAPLNLETDPNSDNFGEQAKGEGQGGFDKELKNYNSLIFGSEVYKHGISNTHVCRLELQFIITIQEIILLLSQKENEWAKKKLNDCTVIFNRFTKLIKDGKDEKGNINGRYASAIAPFVDRHANIIFSFAKSFYAYQTQAFSESMKLLNNIEILTFFGEEILPYTAFQLNNMGCCHLRMKKYNLAAYYLSKALNAIQKISKDNSSETKKYEKLLNFNAIEHYPIVLHNYALAVLQMGRNDEAAEAYLSLAEFWPDNARVWYRTAICHLNKSQEILAENQTQKKNGVYQALLDVPNYVQLVEDERSEQNKSKKTEEVEHKENPYYTRYVLQTRDSTFQRTEEDYNASANPKFISQNPDSNKVNDGSLLAINEKHLKMHLEKAAKCFRNAVLITKKKRTKLQKDNDLEVEVDDQDPNEDESKVNEADNAEGDKKKKTTRILKLKQVRQNKESQDILQSSLVNLAYTSLCLGEINNTINYSKEALELPYITDENKYICLMYLVEAYCSLGNQKEALNQMNSANVTQTILTLARNALGINQAYFTKTLSSKVVIYTNLATAHILNNNLTGAQNAINIALSNIDPNLIPIPMSLLNLMIYLNLKLDKPETALQILKRRRVLNSTNNKLLLRIVKWMN